MFIVIEWLVLQGSRGKLNPIFPLKRLKSHSDGIGEPTFKPTSMAKMKCFPVIKQLAGSEISILPFNLILQLSDLMI